jgi:hypothetical protein
MVGYKKEAALKNQGCESHEKIMQQPYFRVIAAAMFYPEKKVYDNRIIVF